MNRRKLLGRLFLGASALWVRSALAGGVDNPDVAWKISERIDENGNPIGSLSIMVGGVAVPLRTGLQVSYSEIEPGAWLVPLEADIACLGLWAGSGEVLYAIRGDRTVTVLIRRVEEEEQEVVFRRLTTIPID